MIRFATITRMIKSFLTEVSGIGGTTQNRFISPKGLFSKPKNEKAIVLNLARGANQDVVLALQKDIELEDGDVYVTDDKSYIHFHFKDGTIEVKTKKLIFNADEFEVNTDKFDLNAGAFNVNDCATDFNGGTVTSNGTSIDDTHKHTQTAGDHYGAGGITTPPNS